MVELRVRQVAEAQGIRSSGALAEFLGVRRSVSDRLWEGKPLPRLDKLALYAKKLGVKMADLYSENGRPRSKKS
jgi:transcriptional regulator with XRE-family HTH domain